MQVTINSTTEIISKRIIYSISVDGQDYEYVEYEDERGRVIDQELFTTSGEFVDAEEIQTAIEE